MCNFFSWITYKDERYYADSVDSHTVLAINRKWNEDKCNKFEYANGIFKVDQINDIEDNRLNEEGWIEQFVKTKEFEKLCLEAIKRDGYAIRFVKEQTPELCLEAVKQNGYALQFVKKQTPKLCLEAVKQDGYALRFVKKQTP